MARQFSDKKTNEQKNTSSAFLTENFEDALSVIRPGRNFGSLRHCSLLQTLISIDVYIVISCTTSAFSDLRLKDRKYINSSLGHCFNYPSRPLYDIL